MLHPDSSLMGGASRVDSLLKMGECYEARVSPEQDWKQAILLRIENADGENRHAVVKWCDTDSSVIQNVPISAETIRAYNKKRERKLKYDLFEDEVYLRELIGLKKLKVVSTNSSSAELVPSEAKEKHVPVPRVLKAGMLSVDEVRSAEVTCAQSLQEHLSFLKPFISPKVYRNMTRSPSEEPSLVPNVSSDLLFSTTPVSTLPHASSTVVAPTTGLYETPTLLAVPSLIKATLRDYQIKGVSWLVDRYDRCINCILADEMGLGKTLQTITFFAYLKEMRQEGGPHLVVVPLSVMFNWITELKKFCPTLRVLRAHTNQATESKILREKLLDVTSYDVVVTSYEMLKGSLEGSFHRMVWRSVTLDEGHRIKNMLTLLSKACVKLRARFKIILTGTPVQNNLSETYALLHYMVPTIFDLDCGDAFADSFSLNNTNSNSKNRAASASGGGSNGAVQASAAVSKVHIDRKALDAAHYMLRPFLLRRVKTEVEQTLPSKLETLIRCPLSEMQRFWIRALLLRESSAIMGLEGKEGEETEADPENPAGKSSEWKRLQSLLAQLRKAANHPYLFPGAEPKDGEVTEEIITASGKMVVLDRLLTKLTLKGHRVVIFSQFTRTLDIIGDFLDLRGHRHCRLDGSTHRVMREVLINQFNKPNSPYNVYCLSTRAGGEGVNLFTADTVVLFDSDWNPQVDIQAMARVHRIGQTKPVHIYRLVSQGTVEERIVQRAQKKLFLDCMVNRGSTAQGQEIDRKLLAIRQAREAEQAGQAATVSDVSKHPVKKNSNSMSVSGSDDSYWPEEMETGMDSAVEEEKGQVSADEDEDEENEAEDKEPGEGTVSSESVQDISTIHNLRTTTTSNSSNSKKNKNRANLITKSAELQAAEELDASTVMSALKFGWNACFGGSNSSNSSDGGAGDAGGISDAALEAIIDRTRTCDSKVTELLGAGTSSQNSKNNSSSCGSDKQSSRTAVKKEGQTDTTNPSSTNSNSTHNNTNHSHSHSHTTTSSSSAAQLGLQEGQQSSVTAFEEAAPLVDLRQFEGQTVLKKQPKGSLSDISSQWILQSTSRNRQSRLEQVHVTHVGLVSVLKANNYTLEQGESSIFEKEALRHKEWAFGGANSSNKKGKKYEHQDYCQYCWNYGSLICCAFCPASYHIQCVGLRAVPSSMWSCPHHAGCVTCGRRGQAAGFLFRCEMCPNSYCEDCLPAEHTFVGVCERWAELGYATPGSSCFIQCSPGCAKFALEQELHTANEAVMGGGVSPVGNKVKKEKKEKVTTKKAAQGKK